MRIGIVTDSNSGITQAQAARMGVFVLPMPFTIDGQDYFEDISLTQREFYEKLREGSDIATSQPSPEAVMNLWDQVLGEYDQVVHIPMSSALSGSCQTARMLAEDYGGRVQVADNRRISVTQLQAAADAVQMAGKGMDAAQIRQKLEETGPDSSIYITVDTLKYLKKGGRITPAAAALGTLLRIKPVLTIQGGKLDAFAKARTMKQAKTIMLAALSRDLEQRFEDPEAERTHLEIAHTDSEEAALELKEELQAAFPKTGESVMAPLSLSISCHIGPGALAVACTKALF